MTIPDAQYIVITQKEVYDAVLRLDGKVTAHNAQMAHMQAELVEIKKDHEKDHADHEIRIRNLEARQWPLPTVAIILSVAAILATVILKFI